MDPPALQGDADIGGGGDSHFLSWNKFPLLVHFHIFQFLDRKSLNCMRLTSKYVQGEIDYNFGLHIILPPRGAWRRDDHWGPLGQCGINHMITNEMLSNIVFGLEGKLIHTLAMVEVPPAYNPFPFEKIEYPERIKRVHLKFVDIRVIQDILANCRSVSHLSYESSKCPRSVLTFQTIINEVPIPRARQQFLDAIAEYQFPAYPLKFRNLTKLQLSLRFDNFDFGQSDWANVLFILLALPSAHNLTNFSFEMDYTDMFEAEEYHLFIVACIADALVKFPNLSKFKYRGAPSPVFVRGDLAHVLTIFNSLAQRFGSSQLKEFSQVRTPHQRLQEINKIMEKAGESLKNLCEFELKIGRILDINYFLAMAKYLTNLTTCRIVLSRPQSEEERPLRNQALLNFLHPEYGGEPMYKFVRKLHVTRDSDIGYAKWRKLPSINLNKLLNAFRNLEYLEINQNRPLAHMDVEQWNAQELDGLEIDEGVDEDVVLIREISTQIHHDYPEVTIQFPQEVPRYRATIFQQLQVLNLNSVKMLARHMERLLHFRNLRELWLVTSRGYRHNRFGVTTNILFKIMNKLRFLNELRAGILIFPEDNDLHLGYLGALEQLGSVTNEIFVFQP